MTYVAKGEILGEIHAVDPEGKPVTDPRTISAGRVLLVAEACARYLKQVDNLGFKDEPEIARLTNLLALNVITAAKCDGKRLAADVLLIGALLNIELIQVAPGRMDS